MANFGAREWSNSGDLYLEWKRDGGRGLRSGIEDALREAIRSGRLPRGSLLPPTRTLANDLGVSRGTVVQAYAQLSAEGWIRARRGSGTRVAIDHASAAPARVGGTPSARRWRFDLRPGRPDASSFPRAEWLRAQRRAFAEAPSDAFDYGQPEGALALRLELADYLARARGLRVDAEDVIVTTGFTQSLSIATRALAANGVTTVAMEEPSMALHRAVVKAAGIELVLLRVDADGACVEQLDDLSSAAAAILTPNRQHPTGVALSPGRRTMLIEWARAHESYIVEDDYDGEFRYDDSPLGPAQGLDPSRVIYAGTVSKTLAPGVRLGWLVVPRSLHRAIWRQKLLTDGQSGALEQLTFTEFLRSGAYDRHIRRMRLRYRRRRDLLLEAFKSHLPEFKVSGADAGLNLLVHLRDAQSEENLLKATTAAGIGLEGLIAGKFYVSNPEPGVLIGYAASHEHNFPRSVEALVQALTTLKTKT